jgi:MSHA biogenesis protein MshE
MKNIRLRSYKDTANVLIDQGLVDPERIEDARDIQARDGYTLGRAVVDLGVVSEWELASAVVTDMGVPFIRLRDAGDISEASQRVDISLLHRHNILILDHFDGVDTVVIAEPPSLDLLTELSPLLGDKVFFLVALLSDIASVLEKVVPEPALLVEGGGEKRTAEEILQGFDDD